MQLTSFLLLTLGCGVLAHPGHREPESQLIAKHNYNTHARRGLDSCADKLEKRGINARAQERRAATVAKHRRSLETRDTNAANISHLSTNTIINPATLNDSVFTKSGTCVVAPEGEVGPYWVPGEQIRSNVQEDQPGVPIIIEAQFLDLETCEPLTEIWWDV